MKMAHSANWAEWLVGLHDNRFHRAWRQEIAAVLDDFLPIAVGKESEMSDLYEPAGKHMQQEPSDELYGIQ
jgi:hypothetical protein